MTSGGLVILDGPDAVGKTTLANKILDGDDGGYVHLTYDSSWSDPDRELWKLQYFSLIKAAIRLGQGKTTVIDRHWMSEQIYARVYRGGSNLNAECRQWDRVIQRLCGVYVICAPDAESATARHRMMHGQRAEMYSPTPQIFEVAQGFRKLYFGANISGCDYAGWLTTTGGMSDREDALLYDVDKHGDDLDNVVDRIDVHLSTRQATQYPPAFNYSKGNFLGHPRRARFLFVGERINPNKSGRWPFIDYGSSSRTLCEVFARCGFNETEGMWTNAYAEDEHVQTLLEWFPHLKVVSFGAEASVYLEEKRVQHHRAVHPAYARRFNKMDEMVEQLGSILE